MNIPLPLREDILDFYGDRQSFFHEEKNRVRSRNFTQRISRAFATSDKRQALRAARIAPLNFLKFNPRWTSDRDVVLTAVKRNGEALQYASHTLKDDFDVVLAAVKENGKALRHSLWLPFNREVVLAAVRQNGEALRYAVPQLRDDRDVVHAAVQQRGIALEHASEKLQNDRQIVFTAVTQDYYDQGGYALQYASPQLRNDREIVLAAVKTSGEALEHASEALRDDREVVREAMIYSDHAANEFASERLFEDSDLEREVDYERVARGFDDWI